MNNVQKRNNYMNSWPTQTCRRCASAGTLCGVCMNRRTRNHSVSSSIMQTTPVLLVPRLRMPGAVPPSPHSCVFIASSLFEQEEKVRISSLMSTSGFEFQKKRQGKYSVYKTCVMLQHWADNAQNLYLAYFISNLTNRLLFWDGMH